LAKLYDMPETRIDLSPSLDTDRYDLVVVLPRPETREPMFRLMREAIEKYFHVTRDLRQMEVDVLTAPNGIKAHETHEDDAMFGFGSMGFIEAAQESPQVSDAFLLMRIMALPMTPSEEPSSPEEAVRRMKSEML